MKLVVKFTILTLSILLFTSSAFARPYRCHGRVYQEPCNQVTPPNASTDLRGPRAMLSSKEITIEKSSFKKINSNTGHWRGYLSGNGKAKLMLQIFSERTKIATKYIGTVQLNPKDGPTFFSYKTSLPKTMPWDWKLVAIAK